MRTIDKFFLGFFWLFSVVFSCALVNAELYGRYDAQTKMNKDLRAEVEERRTAEHVWREEKTIITSMRNADFQEQQRLRNEIARLMKLLPPEL